MPGEQTIEFIGDSITGGFGVLAPNPDSSYSVTEEDASLSYAYLTAESLNADGFYICRRGVGILINSDGSTDGVMPQIYPYPEAGECNREVHSVFEEDKKVSSGI